MIKYVAPEICNRISPFHPTSQNLFIYLPLLSLPSSSYLLHPTPLESAQHRSKAQTNKHKSRSIRVYIHSPTRPHSFQNTKRNNTTPKLNTQNRAPNFSASLSKTRANEQTAQYARITSARKKDSAAPSTTWTLTFYKLKERPNRLQGEKEHSRRERLGISRAQSLINFLRSPID